MGYFLILGIALIICVVGWLVGWSNRDSAVPNDQTFSKGLRWGAAAVFLLVFLVLTPIRMFHSVPAGHVGVIYQFGNIVGQTDAGLVAIAPWKNLREANVQVQRQSFDQLDSFSQETQDVFIRATLNYQVSPTSIQTLYRTVGPDYFTKLVPNRVNQFFKDETVKYRAVEIAPNRDTIREHVLKRLKKELAPYSIQVDDLLIDNISFSSEFTHAIEDKQIATQEAQAAQNRVAQARYQADQVAARAQGDANAVLIKAEAQAKANRLLNKSLSPQLIQYTAIKTLSPGVSTILLPSNSNFILPNSIFGK